MNCVLSLLVQYLFDPLGSSGTSAFSPVQFFGDSCHVSVLHLLVESGGCMLTQCMLREAANLWFCVFSQAAKTLLRFLLVTILLRQNPSTVYLQGSDKSGLHGSRYSSDSNSSCGGQVTGFHPWTRKFKSMVTHQLLLLVTRDLNLTFAGSGD